MNQYYYSFWPGAYSFKNEVKLFVQFFQEQFDEMMKKIEKTEKATV